jgi:hypothetical protein
VQRQVIRVQLRPGRPLDDDDYFRETTFSMFGTDRAIKSFQLDIHPIADPAEQESCRAWGSVSYTAEVDFTNETTDDCIVFYLFVKPETFARYGAKIAHGLVTEMILRVGSVDGFYSEWSPEVSTDYVKVLTRGSEHKITLPPGHQVEPPRLGYVGKAELHINRRLEFGKRAPERTIPATQAPPAGMLDYRAPAAGMLDYRAYKLLWLIWLPFRLMLWIAAWASIVIAIMISASLNYSVPVRIVIAYAIWEGAAIVLQIVRGILFWFIKKGFFWLVDVVPVKAESIAEAKEMVVGGPITWLGKKLLTDIGSWTEDDTDQLASLMNWRARLFFHSTERIRERVSRFQKMYKTTGKQPGDLIEQERQKVVGDLEYSWFEKVIINPIAFGAMMRIIIISIAIISLDNAMR